MKEKIVKLMKSEGLSPSRLAEILEVQPSGISHLVSGRNKPSFELLKKILRSFPNINPYWLLLDDEKMYCDAESLLSSSDMVEPNVNSANLSPGGDLFAALPQSSAIVAEQQLPLPSSVMLHSEDVKSSNIESSKPQLKQVILLYSDGSCSSYYTK